MRCQAVEGERWPAGLVAFVSLVTQIPLEIQVLHPLHFYTRTILALSQNFRVTSSCIQGFDDRNGRLIRIERTDIVFRPRNMC